mgnify:FL=1
MRSIRTGMLIILCISLFSCLSMAAPLPEDMVFLTEEYPPFNYLENGVPSGLSVELLRTALERAGIPLSTEDISLMAWSDAYRMAESRNNTGLFSIARTPEREELFRWAGPLMQCPLVFFAENESLKTSRPENKDLRAVVIRDDIGMYVGKEAGILEENIFQVTTPAEAVQRLVDGTSDVWVYALYPGESLIQTIAEDPDSFYILDDLGRSTYYIAFNLNTDPEIIETIQTELDEMKVDRKDEGITTYEKIVGKYIGPICAEKSQTRQQITDLVNLTVDAISRDATGTIADIQNGRHPYKDRSDPSLYVYVFDTGVTLIANAAQPDLAGTNFSGKVDASGKKFRDEIVTGAMKQGSGIVSYTYSNPIETGIFYKEAYYTLVTGSDRKQYVVGAGRYLSCDEV